MSRGKPKLWSGVVATPFVLSGVFSYFFTTEIPSSVATLAVVFGLTIFTIGVYVHQVSQPRPTLSKREEVLGVRNPSQRVALAKIVISIPFLIATTYLLFFTIKPYLYPTVTFLIGLFFFSTGMLTYWSNCLTRYYITNQRVVRAFKFVSKITKEIPVDKMRGIQERRSVTETLVGLGNVRVASGAGGGTLEIVIRNIHNPGDFAQELRNLETYYSWDSQKKEETDLSIQKKDQETRQKKTEPRTQDHHRKLVNSSGTNGEGRQKDSRKHKGPGGSKDRLSKKPGSDGSKEEENGSDEKKEDDEKEEDGVLSKFSGKWYEPESDVYSYAVVNPNGENSFYKKREELKSALKRWYGDDEEGKPAEEAEPLEKPDSPILNEYSDKWKLSEDEEGFKVLGPEDEVKNVKYQEDLENLIEWWYDADWDVLEKYNDKWSYDHTFNEFQVVFPDGTIYTFGTADELANKLKNWYE